MVTRVPWTDETGGSTPPILTKQARVMECRHAGLRNRWLKCRTGSNPVLGTTQIK
jgi:hypothetical protein